MAEPTLSAPLFALTVVTGMVDSVSYLGLGHVFVANMTGNVAFLGFAAGGAQEFSIAATLAAIAAFVGGAMAGGALAVRIGARREKFLGSAIGINVILVAVALAASLAADDGSALQFTLIASLGVAMGMQNAAARFLAVPDLTTTVLTLTLTGLAADSSLAGGANPRMGRRLAAIGAMLAGATIGAYLLLRVGLPAALGATLVLLAATAVASWRQKPAA